MTIQDIDKTAFEQDWADWHRKHEAQLAAEHGFLAITSLNWLSDQPQRFADAPGTWTTGPGGPAVLLEESEELVIDGSRVTGRYEFGSIPERGGVNAASGNAIIEVARRGGNDIVRPRHPEHPLRADFAGVPAFAPSPRWAVRARYLRFAEPRPTTVGSVVEGLLHVYAAPGYLQFEIGGQLLCLTAFNGHRPGSLSVLFTDATSGVTTYPANRSLQVAEPAGDETATIDFNRAVNLPCAYTDYATCPVPPAENRLPVAIEAGEKLPYEFGS
jgi:uncharacterized protein (DUF1684 family)